jgi:hypothetical protein
VLLQKIWRILTLTLANGLKIFLYLPLPWQPSFTPRFADPPQKVCLKAKNNFAIAFSQPKKIRGERELPFVFFQKFQFTTANEEVLYEQI